LIALLKFSGYRKNMILGMTVILAISFLFEGRSAFGANPAVGDQNWAMFGHDLSHTGSSPSTGPNTNNTLWSYPMTYTVFSSPAVVDGKIFISLLAGAIYCFDAASGTRIWNYTTGGLIYSTPTVVNGKVYIGLEDGIGSQTGAIYCFDAATGTRLWNYTSGAIFGICCCGC
jgi:outer membrane protein assembly factor BamB